MVAEVVSIDRWDRACFASRLLVATLFRIADGLVVRQSEMS